MHLGMVISGILDIRGHTQVEGYSEYHHAINGYWVVDNLGDSWSKKLIKEINSANSNLLVQCDDQ